MVKEIDRSDYCKKWAKTLQKVINSQDKDMIDKLIKEETRKIKIHLCKDYDNILYFLALTKCTDIVTYLIKEGWDVNVQDKYGSPPLFQAINAGNVNMVRTLLDAGASVHQSNEYRCTALLVACSCDVKKNPVAAYQIIKMIVDAGGNVRAKNIRGSTPLSLAVSHWYPAYAIKYLLDKGADVNEADEDGKTPLHYRGLRLDVVKLLVKAGSNVDRNERYTGDSILHHAASKLNLDVIKFVVEAGASVNVYNQKMLDPLCSIFTRPNLTRVNRTKKAIQCMEYLLQHGAKINRQDRNKSPLYIALKNTQKVEIIRYLLSRGAEINYDDEVVIDAMNQNLQIAKFLVSYGTIFFMEEECDKLGNFDPSLLLNDQLSHYNECKKELELMKNTPIHNSLTIHHILYNKSFKTFLTYNKVLKKFKTLRVNKIFPIYNDILHMQFYKLRKYKKIEVKAACGLSNLLNLDKNAHTIIFDRIIAYLSLGDLKTLAKI